MMTTGSDHDVCYDCTCIFTLYSLWLPWWTMMFLNHFVNIVTNDHFFKFSCEVYYIYLTAVNRDLAFGWPKILSQSHDIDIFFLIYGCIIDLFFFVIYNLIYVYQWSTADMFYWSDHNIHIMFDLESFKQRLKKAFGVTWSPNTMSI